MTAAPEALDLRSWRGQWRPDLLPGFVATTLRVAPGAVPSTAGVRGLRLADPVLTLVRRAVPGGGEPVRRPHGVVVHLHGYNDYFFHLHLAHAVEERGWALYAVDARRAGRSLRPGEPAHLQLDLREQAGDLDRAVARVRAMHPDVPVVVHAHSTGGLVAALWAHSRRGSGVLDALVLNGPLLDLRRGVPEPVLDGVVAAAARADPLRVLSARPSHYAGHLQSAAGGGWGFDPALKRPGGVPVRAGWLRAVRAGQRLVAAGLRIDVPVTVACSARSGPDSLTNPRIGLEDTVLDVRRVMRRAPGLGADVTTVAVEDAVHDLTLSAPRPRERYLDLLGEVLDRTAAEPRR